MDRVGDKACRRTVTKQTEESARALHRDTRYTIPTRKTTSAANPPPKGHPGLPGQTGSAEATAVASWPPPFRSARCPQRLVCTLRPCGPLACLERLLLDSAAPWRLTVQRPSRAPGLLGHLHPSLPLLRRCTIASPLFRLQRCRLGAPWRCFCRPKRGICRAVSMPPGWSAAPIGSGSFGYPSSMRRRSSSRLLDRLVPGRVGPC